MYKQKLSEEVKDALKRGDKELLVDLLRKSDEKLIADLKTKKDDVRFLQGASHIIDNLLKILG